MSSMSESLLIIMGTWLNIHMHQPRTGVVLLSLTTAEHMMRHCYKINLFKLLSAISGQRVKITNK